MRFDMAERGRRTEAVVMRYRGRPFDWAKARTCVHLARAQMRALGHRPPPIPQFRSERGALTALRKSGYEDMAAMFDAMLPRIAPASMWLGDLALLRGCEAFDAVVISAGAVGGKLIGYHLDHLDQGVISIVPVEFIGAWRL
jgi:hypothetical protein